MKFLIILSAFFSISAFAADGSSGCGPGWFVFKENSLISSALRATTNGFLFPTTTVGMTLGTSNCTQHKIVMKEKESLHFATNNFYELKSEAAKGNGSFILAFTETLGCRAEGAPVLGKELKNNYDEIFKHSHIEAQKALIEVYKVILTKPHVARFCSDFA